MIQQIKHMQINKISANQKRAFFATKVFISLLILFLLVRKISFDEILIAAQTARTGFILAAFLLLSANLFCQYKRWAYLVRFESPSASMFEILSSIFAGITLGLITPGRIGEFGRFLFIKNAQWPRLFGFVFLEKIYTMCALYFAGIIGLGFYFMDKVELHIKWVLGLSILIAITVLLYIILKPSLLKGLFVYAEKKWGQKKRLSLFVSINSEITGKTTRYLFLNSFGQVFIYLTQFVLLVMAFSPCNIFKGYFAAASTMITKAALPIAIGDLGIREAAAIFYFKEIGVSHVAAFNASILLFVINLFIPGIIGLVLILKFKMNETSLNRGGVS